MIVRPTKTLLLINGSVISACKKVTIDTKPIFVSIEPVGGARENKCTYNCEDYVETNGGEIVLGWKISEWKNVFFEFIGHAIIKNENGPLCITPSRYEENRLLFLEDPSLTFDFCDKNARLPSQTINISKHQEVAALIEIEERIKQIKCKYPVGSGVLRLYGNDASTITALENEKNTLIPLILKKTTHHNDKCFCGSGKKYRKCCQNRGL